MENKELLGKIVNILNDNSKHFNITLEILKIMQEFEKEKNEMKEEIANLKKRVLKLEIKNKLFEGN